MPQNPRHINAGKLAPTFHLYSATRANDKICAIQNFVEGSTAAQLKAAGATHVWENVAIGELDNTIGRAQNLSTAAFGSTSPSEATVRAVAEATTLYQNMVITDEFGEGTFPQDNVTQTSYQFSDQINIKAAREGKNVKQFGEYGSQALHYSQDWKRTFNGAREPMSDYMRSLLQPNISTRIDTCLLKSYLTGSMKNVRGRTVGYYYAFEKFPIGDYINTIAVQAMYQYNESNQDCIAFTWPKMQSNGHMVDVPQRDGGTRRPNGTYGYDFPAVPLEVMKMFGYFFPLFFEGDYLWGDWGIKPNDDDAYSAPYAGIDTFFVGTDWYTQCIPTLNQAGRALVCCDFTANGQRFSYTGTERLISRKGSPHYNNYYFNQGADTKKGFCICIPGTTPKFIYVNPYRSPIDYENITAHYDGRDFILGTIPGMTLYVS
jgi:hypothetical protein